jgi:acetylornithine deacetylase/succinyl-diaminopimelate desuccinylase-like protein
MIYNHYDVQPPDPWDEWTSPPFEPQLRDGKLYARGVADNKADLVARLTAIRAYQETVGPLPLRLLYVIEGQEEMGSPRLFDFARKQQHLLVGVDGCLWEFGYKSTQERPVVNLGVKGILSVELRVATASSDAHSGNGGLFPNAAWRLVEALHTLRDPAGQVTIDGLPGHVRPPSPRDLALLAEIPHDDEAVQAAYGLRQGFLGGLAGAAAVRRLLLEPALTINGLLSGYTGPGSKTVIPARAMAKLDLRLVPDLTPDLARQLLRDHLDRRGYADVEIVQSESGLMPMRTDPGAGIVQAVTAALRSVSANPPLVYPSSAGSGPMYELCGAAGIPVASWGVGWHNSRAHAPDESIRLADFMEGIKVMGRLLDNFADLPDGA